MKEELEFYSRHGYVVVPDALSAEEVRALNAAIDADLSANRALWQDRGNGRLQSVFTLLAQPAMDITLRAPRLLPLMEAILGNSLCAEEHSVMIRGSNPKATECVWHRDTGSVGPAPTYTNYFSMVFYLTDVDQTSHTFSVLPDSVQAPPLPGLDSYDIDRALHITGPAGTAVFFNAALLHAGCVRETPQERRTVHVYCGRSSLPAMSNHTIFPPRLWEGKDEATQRYYRRHNRVTDLILANFRN